MDSVKTTRVFVYGTLKPGGRYHATYCGPFSFFAEEAIAKGRLFDFPQLGYPGAMEDRDSTIRGCLLTFNHYPEEVLSKLDVLEGFDPKRPMDANEYYRIQVEVLSPLGLSLTDQAWCYFMKLRTIEALNGVLLPDGIWHIEPSNH